MEFRNHPIIMFKGVISFLLGSAIFYFKVIITEDKARYESKFVLYAFLIFFVVFMIFSIVKGYIKWKNTVIRLDEKNLYYFYRGIVKRTEKQLSFENISSININKTILDRLLGIVKLSIDVDSSTTADTTDFEVVFSFKKAEEFRNKVYTYKNQNCENNFDYTSNDEINIRKDNKTFRSKKSEKKVKNTVDFRKIFASYFFRNIDEDEDNNFSKEYYKEYSFFESLRHTVLDITIFDVFLVAITSSLFIYDLKGRGKIVALIFLMGFIIDLMKNFNKSMKFSCKRYRDKIEVKYGVFSEQRFLIPIEKINSINVKQSILSRFFRLMCLEVKVIGIGNEKSEQGILSLYMKKEEMEDYLSNVIPEQTLKWDFISQPKKIFYYNVFRNTLFALVIAYILLTFVHVNSYLVYISIVAFLILVASMGYYNQGVLLTNDSIYFRKGIFSVNTEMLDFSRIDQVELIQTWRHRLMGVMNVEIYYKSNSGKDSIRIGYYNLECYNKEF